MENNSLQWSFSDVIPFKHIDGVIVPVKVDAHPRNISVYKKGSDNDVRWQYFVLSDLAIGAAMVCLRDLELKYVEELLNKVIYAEDNIWRSMMFDGVVGKFYDTYTVLYEYGTGISTSNSSVWSERLKNDWKNNDKILADRNNLDKFQLKMWKAYNTKGKIKKLFIKGKLKNSLFYNRRKSIGYLP